MAAVKLRRIQADDMDDLRRWNKQEEWVNSEAELTLWPQFLGEAFIAAEHEGKFAGCVTCPRISPTLGGFGYLLVDRDKRGLGIGRALMNRAHAYLELDKGERNIFLNGRGSMVDTYVKRGYQITCWNVVSCKTKAPLKRESIKIPTANGIDIVIIDDTNIGQVIEYDHSIQPVEREEYLKLFCKQNGVIGSAAILDGGIIGYVLVHGTLGKELHKIGPFYANDSQIACVLLGNVVRKNDVIKSLFMEYPDTNAENVKPILEMFGMADDSSLLRQYTKEKIDYKHENVYALTNTDIYPF